MDEKHVGKRIRNLRTERGFSQATLSQKAGIQRASLCRIELGRVEPRIRTIAALAEALDVSAASVLIDFPNSFGVSVEANEHA